MAETEHEKPVEATVDGDYVDSLIEDRHPDAPEEEPAVIVPTAEGKRYGPAGIDLSDPAVRRRSTALLTDSLARIGSEELSDGELSFLRSVEDEDEGTS
jgi:hypothetical protein